MATPHYPKTVLQSLPLTLRGVPIIPIPNYSKASGVFSSSCRKAASSPPLYFHQAGPRDSFPLVTPFVHVGTYPTRKYALFFLLKRHALRVSAPIGLYLHPLFLRTLGCLAFGLLLARFGLRYLSIGKVTVARLFIRIIVPIRRAPLEKDARP